MEDAESILKQKLKSNEEIIVTLDCYQVVSSEHQNRLLALIKNLGNQSYAIFSFSVLNLPIQLISDLQVNATFPIDQTFILDTFVEPTAISSNQFKINYGDQEHTFFYYPLESTVFAMGKFNDTVKKIMQECPDNQNFNWLEFYQRSDMSEINLAIASGKESLKSRESKFKEELDRRKSEYMTEEPYKIFCGTWNVNETTFNDEELDLSIWLRAGSKDPPDIFAIGFQEISMAAEAILLSETRPDQAWNARIMRGLPPEDKYYMVASVRLVGMMLTIFCKQSLKNSIKRVSQSYCGTGTMKFGNKGAVGVSLQLNETWICFVNSHLAAHAQEFERRNEDHDEIIRRLQFVEGIRTRCIDEHHQIFWMGDLNYRLNLSDDQVKTFLHYDKLIYYDQLHIERQKGRVFVGYNEGKIAFIPTYKYDVGTDKWDSSEKCRVPAWCDRIFWKTKRLRVEQLCYDSIMEIRGSDHKPVYAVFISNIYTRDENKFKRVHEEVLKTVDKYENDNQPQIYVPETDLDFGVLRFNEKVTRELLVANNCHLPVVFKFKPKEDNSNSICEDWIQISEMKKELLTGQSHTIRIEINIDEKVVGKVVNKLKENGGSNQLLDILVLHVENGRDIFITIMGEFHPSCFGFRFETLMKLTKPLAEYEFAEVIRIEKDTENKIPYYNRKQIPRELWQLIDYLYKHGLQKRDLFSIRKRFKDDPTKINRVRDWLDSWSTEDFPCDPYVAGEVLLILLESLPTPLIAIPEKDLSFIAAYTDKCRDLLNNRVTPFRRRIFWYICMFLKELQGNYHVNSMDDRTIASIFSRAMCRHKNEQYQMRFLQNFLSTDVKNFARVDFEC